MCETCESIQAQIKRAEEANLPEKARVLSVILSGHIENQHNQHMVTVTPDHVVIGGVTWKVSEAENGIA